MELFLYLSEDGVWRQRCRKHISTEPGKRPRKPAVNYQRFIADARHTCIACFYQQKQSALESQQAPRAQDHNYRSNYDQPHFITSPNHGQDDEAQP